MKAIILVGGEGTRLRPLTYNVPKPLLPLCGIPYLELQLAWLKQYGVTKVVLSLGYLPTQFEKHFKSGEFQGIEIKYVIEDEPLGTGGAIKFASYALDLEEDESFLVFNGDILTEFNITELVEKHENSDSIATIGLTQVEDPTKFGVVPTKENGEIVAFVEKPLKNTAPTNWINAGMYIFSSKILELIPDGIQISIERDTFPYILESQRRMFAVKSEGFWIDIGTPEQYIQSNKLILEHLDSLYFKDIVLYDKTQIKPNLWTGSNCSIEDSATFSGTVILGDNVKIGKQANISNSYIGNHSNIGEDVIVNASFIANSSTVSNQCTIEESVVASGTHVGHDCIISDITLIGSEVNVMPGSKHFGDKVPQEVIIKEST